ncbi:hypothetical protein [Pedobacter nutrimenti]|uniref:Uncharacterized protein n=1 Tax=Pedobacter nutrimenti TaxID=1241337 RepID=A0A318UE47_9SPHI|nr:hypothetical protein [Pedobacter nutrimenti]PYF74642.1 hypothetical protein B0O44_10387 [Pedobacter nutrimenti]
MIEITDQSVPALPNESIVQSDGLNYIFIQASSSETRRFTVKKIPVKKSIEGKVAQR